MQTWILTFPEIGALDAQLDEVNIALGEVRSLKKLSEMEWAVYWGAIQEISDRNGGTYRLPGRPWRFSRENLQPLGDPAFQGERVRRVGERLDPRNDRRRCRQRRRHGKDQQSVVADDRILNRRPPGSGGQIRQHLAEALTLARARFTGSQAGVSVSGALAAGCSRT